MNFKQGIAQHMGILFHVFGSQGRFAYKWKGVIANKQIIKKKQVPALVVDFSSNDASFDNSQSILNGVIGVCQDLLIKKDYEMVHLVFFGGSAHHFTVNSETYTSEITNKMHNYFNNRSQFDLFNHKRTEPVNAFLTVFDKASKNITAGHINIMFITSNEFSAIEPIPYRVIWKNVCSIAKNLRNTVEIHVIGCLNDSLENIREMKVEFEGVTTDFTYSSITKSAEIESKMLEISGKIFEKTINSVKMPDDTFLVEDGICYHNKPLLSFTEDNVIGEEIKKYQVQEMAVVEIIHLNILIGAKLKETDKKIKEAMLTSDPIVEYNMLLNDLVKFRHTAAGAYLYTRGKIKDSGIVKTSALSDLITILTTMSLRINKLRELVLTKLDKKKIFEHATKIFSASLCAKPGKEQTIDNMEQIVSILSENPLILTKKDHDNINLAQKLCVLNKYYQCFYTYNNWQQIVETNGLIGFLVRYIGKKHDESTLLSTLIELFDTTMFVSLNGCQQAQEIFCGDKDTYMFVPIATDPYFILKFDQAKSQLKHLTGYSDETLANKLVSLYADVIYEYVCKCTYISMVERHHQVALLINTIRIITSQLNCVYGSKGEPLVKSEILYHISIGNTEPCMFKYAFDVCIHLVASSHADYMSALSVYNSTHEKELSLEDFKLLLWKMAYRHLIMKTYSIYSCLWSDLGSWGLKPESKLRLDLEEMLKNKDMVEVNKFIENETMTNEKIMHKTQYHSEIVSKYIRNKDTQTFIILMDICDRTGDDYWDSLNRSFIPNQLGIPEFNLKTKFSNDLLSDIVYYSIWESEVYAQDCYPLKSYDDLLKHAVAKINTNYSNLGSLINTISESSAKNANEGKLVTNDLFSDTFNEYIKVLRKTVADTNEYYGYTLGKSIDEICDFLKFAKRNNEVKSLPISFTKKMELDINNLFLEVFNKLIEFAEFKKKIIIILGKRAANDLVTFYANNNAYDPLLNLYNYCKVKNHKITIKESTKLPFSCPANITSPLFLQEMSDAEFKQYYKLVGLPTGTRKSKISRFVNWIPRLHVFMAANVHMQRNEFLEGVRDQIKGKGILDAEIKEYLQYANEFYDIFK